MYKDWNDYLANNHLQQGVMIYPKDGTYTPVDANGLPEAKVTLVAKETHSCKPLARAKNFFDQVVVVTGTALTAAAVVTAVPLGIFAASTLAAVSTGSYYIGLACTAYSVTMCVFVSPYFTVLFTFSRNGYDKITHDESVLTEGLLVATTLFSGLTSFWNNRVSKSMGEHVRKMELWDTVVAGSIFEIMYL